MIAELRTVAKSFASKPVLREVSLAVEEGAIFGVLGANGAGKTTLLAILQGAMRPDRGAARLFGIDAARLSTRERGYLGVQLDRGGLPLNLNALEVLKLIRTLYEQGDSPALMLERVGLGHVRRCLVRDLSMGQHRRLAVAAALVGRPRLCFLDEPSLALDPEGRSLLWELLRVRNREGTTFVLTTNATGEAESLCDEIAFLRAGIVVECGTPAAIVNRQRAHHHFRIEGDCRGALRGRPEIVALESSASHTLVVSRDPIGTLRALLVAAPERLERLRWVPPRLEDALYPGPGPED